jgi:hypothetical protein
VLVYGDWLSQVKDPFFNESQVRDLFLFFKISNQDIIKSVRRPQVHKEYTREAK